jgi:DNA ligase-1
LDEVIKIFKQIQSTSSLKEKAKIIKENESNDLFKKCLKFLLDSNVVTGISEKKIHKKLEFTIKGFSPIWKTIDKSEWESCMKYLKIHNTGTDTDIYWIQTFLNSQSEKNKEFYEQMITKKFRLGADAKLVNKVIPNLISTFDVQLGTPIEKCKLKGNEKIFISRKLNGCRCAFVGNKCMTRQGKKYKGLDHITNDLINMGYSNMFVDGELLYKNEEGLSDSEAFQKGTGIAMSKDNDKTQLKFVVFDIFPLNEFYQGKSKDIYKTRKENLYKLQKKLNLYKTDNIEIVPLCYEGYDHSEIQKWLDYAEDNDWEGCIINLNTQYECKRTKNLIKVKAFKDCDVRCIKIEEGSGRNKGTLGAIVVNYKGNEVNVGSGFSDEDRNYFWNNPDKIIGKIVTVKYKEETKNKNGGISIQFPTLVGVRFDKDEESYK